MLNYRQYSNNVAQKGTPGLEFAIALLGLGTTLCRMSLHHLFTDHPDSVGESYGEHCAVATGFGLRMILGGLACLLHGLLPFLFQRTGSNCITELHQRMVARQRRPQPTATLAPRPIGRAAAR